MLDYTQLIFFLCFRISKKHISHDTVLFDPFGQFLRALIKGCCNDLTVNVCCNDLTANIWDICNQIGVIRHPYISNNIPINRVDHEKTGYSYAKNAADLNAFVFAT